MHDIDDKRRPTVDSVVLFLNNWEKTSYFMATSGTVNHNSQQSTPK